MKTFRILNIEHHQQEHSEDSEHQKHSEHQQISNINKPNPPFRLSPNSLLSDNTHRFFARIGSSLYKSFFGHSFCYLVFKTLNPRNTANGDFENPNWKRKRNKDKKRSLDLGSIDETSETHLEIKKSKKSEPKSSYFGVELEQRGEGEKCELGFDPKESITICGFALVLINFLLYFVFFMKHRGTI
ncbi:hypothetical protein LOK49_LG01G02790 [Camellia lanceoleosa]|uniref:Uncharacterized protein n=1 Tax=Camellia lanceoleosa TaxID=1840588 RepID=A0ACC0J431_9ERIC|nr:hypothetical protein LOK49_LG01G02790 [Camellia lanceoleosa]